MRTRRAASAPLPTAAASGSSILREGVPGNKQGDKGLIVDVHPHPEKLLDVGRLCRYLPLMHAGQTPTGITVYADANGTNKVIVHFPGKDFAAGAVGSLGSPIYWSLQGRKVVGVGITRLGRTDYQRGPFLLIETAKYDDLTVRQAFFFGPVDVIRSDRLQWISAMPREILVSSFHIKGLVVDMATRQPNYLSSIGTHTAPATPHYPPQVAVQRLHLPSYNWKAEKFDMRSLHAIQTTAILSAVKTIRVQKRVAPVDYLEPPMPCCTGLYIEHDGGVPPSSLGRWDGSSGRPSDVIYDAADGTPLKVIAFEYYRPVAWRIDGTMHWYIRSIRVNPPIPEDRDLVQHFWNQNTGVFYWSEEMAITSRPRNPNNNRYLAWFYTPTTDNIIWVDASTLQITPRTPRDLITKRLNLDKELFQR